MMASNKAIPTFVFFYHPKCSWCKKVHEEWVNLGKKFNVDGTGVRIEAVNVSYSIDKKDLGITTLPDFRLFRAGDDSVGPPIHLKKDPKIRNVEGFTKFLEANGITMPNEKERSKDYEVKEEK